MRKNNKKGISPLIATVLIIGFTIVLAALVITWGTKLFKTTVEETESASKFSVACSTGLKLEVLKADADNTNLATLKLRNNNQDRRVDDFKFVVNYEDDNPSAEGDVASPELLDETGTVVLDADGNPRMDTKLEFPVPKTLTVQGSLPLDTTAVDNSIKSIDVYPAFEIEGETKFCENAVNVKV